MFKKTLISLLVVLSGNAMAVELNPAEVKKLLEGDQPGCVSISFAPDDVKFNTATRVYVPELSKIMVNPVLDAFSITKNPDQQKYLAQLNALKEVGLVSLTDKNIYPMINNTYMTVIKNAPAPVETQTEPGYLFELTKKGKEIFIGEIDHTTPMACIGEKDLTIVSVKPNSSIPNSFNVEYIVKIANRPEWLNNNALKQEIPSINAGIAELERTVDVVTMTNRDGIWEVGYD